MSAIASSQHTVGTPEDGSEDAAKEAGRRFHLLSYFIGLLTALTLVGGSVLLLRRADPAPIQLLPPPTPTPTATPAPTATPGPIVVFVSGAVVQPGVYPLAPNARVGDAIAAAGGLSEDANPALINQAQPIFDGAQVHVPAATEQQAGAAGPAPGLSGLLPTPTTATGANPAASTGLINLNTATAAELESLPGIGASKAAAIIANRPYQAVDDLDRVPGIGASLLGRLRPLVTAN